MMLLKNVRIPEKNGEFLHTDILIKDGRIEKIAPCINEKVKSYDLKNAVVIPGAIDVHVHLREPGFSHKEDIESGTRAALKGGITTVMAMPNTNPTPDSVENINIIKDLIGKKAVVSIYPFASITKCEKGKELVDIKTLAKHVKAFSDDGVGVNDMELLEKAMTLAKESGSIIASHAEADGCIDSIQSEIVAVERELKLVKKTGCKYHFCHISLRKSLEMIRRAQQDGVDVTCEVTPHHLFLCENDIKNSNYKMNPPLRSYDDMLAVREALLNGIATIVATDHAPHTENEKNAEYGKAPNGIIGLETLIPLLYTNFVKTGLAGFEDLTNWITINPAKRFNLPFTTIKEGNKADLTALDIDTCRVYLKDEVISKSKNSPFFGETLYGFSSFTMCGENIIYTNLEGKDE